MSGFSISCYEWDSSTGSETPDKSRYQTSGEDQSEFESNGICRQLAIVRVCKSGDYDLGCEGKESRYSLRLALSITTVPVSTDVGMGVPGAARQSLN